MNRRPALRHVLCAGLIALPALLSCGAVQAQSYNPYRSQYNRWNNNFSGYGTGSREYRREIREMNPYGNDYRQWQRNYGRSYRW
jgi:hypothetical protein